MSLRELNFGAATGAQLRRRWFRAAHVDLYVWQNDTGEIQGFQLCYQMSGQFAFGWQREQGFSHYRIDDGEPDPFRNDTPLMVADGSPNGKVLDAIVFGIRDALPAPILDFVRARIAEFA